MGCKCERIFWLLCLATYKKLSMFVQLQPTLFWTLFRHQKKGLSSSAKSLI